MKKLLRFYSFEIPTICGNFRLMIEVLLLGLFALKVKILLLNSIGGFQHLFQWIRLFLIRSYSLLGSVIVCQLNYAPGSPYGQMKGGK